MYRFDKKKKFIIILISVILIGQILEFSPTTNTRQATYNEKHPKKMMHDNKKPRNPIQDESVTSIDLNSKLSNQYYENENVPTSQGSLESFEKVVPKISGLPTMDDNEVRSELTISNDADLLLKAQSNQWGGTGTEFDPITIENYNFTGGSPDVRLNVTDVQLYFVILNCMFENAANLTIFQNASNAIIKGNIFSSATEFGLFLDVESDNNIVVFNVFENTASGGINANDNGTSNEYHCNYWDDKSGSTTGGIYDLEYSVPGNSVPQTYDYFPREFEQIWNHAELTFGSEAFLKQEARKYGILGNGSKNNPFRIEYTNFSKPSESPLVWLTDTDSFIVIRNCSFFGGDIVDGIYLYDVSNVTIENAEIKNCINGVYVEYDSSHIDISNINISHCSSNGLYIDNTNHTFYTDCFIEQTRGNGVYLSACFNTTFSGCIIKNSSSYGIYVLSGEITTLCNSSIFNNDDTGIRFDGRDAAANINTTLHDVQIYNNLGDGIYFEDSVDATINNTILRNNFNGMYLYYGSNNTLINNSHVIDNSNDGISFIYTSYNTIVNSTNFIDNSNNGLVFSSLGGGSEDCIVDSTNVSHSSTGITLRDGYNITLKRLNIANCTPLVGIRILSDFGAAHGHTLSMINIQNCTTGIQEYAGSSSTAQLYNISFLHMNISNCGTGMDLNSVNYPLIARNLSFLEIYDCTYGIILHNAESSQITNSYIHDTDNAIEIYDSTSLLVNNTEIYNNTGAGMFLTDTENSTIDYTNMRYNSYGLRILMGCSNNTIARSSFWNNTNIGVQINPNVENNTLSFLDIYYNNIGIELYKGFNHTIINCQIHENNQGILLTQEEGWSSEFNEFYNNNISSNNVGVLIDAGAYNTFTSNIVEDNGVGVNLTNSYGMITTHNNTFTENYFFDNNAWDNGSDTDWNNTMHGNYWSSYPGTDDNKDGIGDTPYAIPPGGADYKPLYLDPIILNPLNQTYSQSDIPIIILNSTNAETCWVQYYSEGTWSVNQHLSWNGSHWTLDRIWAPGIYRLRAYCNNSLGLEFSSEIFFTYSMMEPSDPPNIILLFPENNSILNSDVYVFLEIVGSNGSYIYNWDTGQNNTLNVSEPISFPTFDGLHSLEVFACNSMGDWQYAYFEFTIDDTDPTIEPYDVSDGAEVGNGTWIPFEVNDTHYEMFWYYWVDEDDQSSEIVYTTVPGTVAPATPGNWELHVYANDTAGNVAEMTLDLQILQAVPLGLVYPVGGEYITGYCYIMWVSNESLQVDLSYSPDGGVTWISIASDITETEYLWDTTMVANGTEYQVRVVSTTLGKPGEDHSANDFTIYNDPLPPGTSIYSLPDISVRIVLSELTDVSIQRMFNVSLGIQSDPEFFYDTGLFVNITLENPDALVSMNITFSYAAIEDELISQGLNISELSVYFWNETSLQWEPADVVEIDETNKVVMGYFEHSTVIGVLGRSKASERGGNPFLLFFIAVVTVLAALGGAFLIYEHRLRTSQGNPSLIDKLRKLFAEQFQKKDTND